jgi:hypothetical protein
MLLILSTSIPTAFLGSLPLTYLDIQAQPFAKAPEVYL